MDAEGPLRPAATLARADVHAVLALEGRGARPPTRTQVELALRLEAALAAFAGDRAACEAAASRALALIRARQGDAAPVDVTTQLERLRDWARAPR